MHPRLLFAQPSACWSAKTFALVVCAATFLMLASPSSVVFAEAEYYEYDALGRLIGVQYSSGLKQSFHYDSAGNRTLVHCDDAPIDDDIPTRGIGPNLINLNSWPTDEAPSGAPQIPEWPSGSTYYSEARWTRAAGPGHSNCVTALETGQTQSDANGGGANPTNAFGIDPTKAYEFSIYFKKYDLDWQSLYFGTKTGGMVENVTNYSANNNPYFLAWGLSTQQAYLTPHKWYKIVAYVFPEGYPIQSNADWGGLYEVATGTRIASIRNYRWSDNRSSNAAYARFFTYYSQSQQNTFTTYYYLPSVRETDTSYVPITPALTISHTNASEGGAVEYKVRLSQVTTVTVKANYAVSHPGGTASASSDDYTASSGTVTIPPGGTSADIAVSTTEDSECEVNERIRLTLSSPVRATIAESSELAYIIDDETQPPNIAPSAGNDSYLYVINGREPPNKYIEPLGNDSDPDCDTLSIISITQPPPPLVATLVSPTTIHYKVGPDYSGSFTYTVSDGNGGTDTGTIAVTVR